MALPTVVDSKGGLERRLRCSVRLNSAKLLPGSAAGVAKDFGLSLLQWAQMLLAAEDLRTLVRVKVADDNDLKTASQGLQLCAEFFAGLSRLAGMRGVTEFEVLNELSLSA